MNTQDFKRKLTAVLSADGVDRFHQVFTRLRRRPRSKRITSLTPWRARGCGFNLIRQTTHARRF